MSNKFFLNFVLDFGSKSIKRPTDNENLTASLAAGVTVALVAKSPGESSSQGILQTHDNVSFNSISAQSTGNMFFSY